MHSGQKERTLGEWGVVLENEQGRAREGVGVKTRESLAKVLFECSLNALFPKKEKGETKESRRLG